jgi:ACS family hexuronate transporter-like MFS transporter
MDSIGAEVACRAGCARRGVAVSDRSRKSNLRWVVCGLLFLITTVNYMDRSALGLVEPILKHILGGDLDLALYNKHYSNIVTCFIVAYGLGSLVAGRVIDRIGTKKGLALSIAVWALASISHAFMRTVTGFGVARFALGLGEAGNFPAALKATADWFPVEERALATGIFNSGTSAASLVAPLLIPFVALRYGWQTAFFTTGGLSLLWLGCWLLFPYNRLRLQFGNSATPSPALPELVAKAPLSQGTTSQLAEKLIPGRQQRQGTTLVVPKQAGKQGALPPGGSELSTAEPLLKHAEHAPRASFKSLLRKRGTWAFALSKAATDPVWWFYLYWLPKFFHERFSVDMSQLGLPLIIVYVGATVGSIGGGWLAGFVMRRGHSLRSGRRFAMMFCAFCALAVILVPFVHLLWQAIALLCIATAAHQGFSSNLLSTPSDMFPSSSVGTVVGIGGAVGSVGSTIVITMIGILWTNHSLLIFFIAGFAYLLSMIVFQREALASVPDELPGPART